MSIVLENLRRDARMRIESDSHMSAAWVIIPLLPVVGGILFFVLIIAASLSLGNVFTNTTTTTGTSNGASLGLFFAVLAFFYIGLFVVGIVFAIMIYKLVKRRNTHFNRQQFLYEDL